MHDRYYADMGSIAFSLLHPEQRSTAPYEPAETPAFFTDLNLGRVIESVTTGKDEYALAPFFHLPLQDIESVCYRQAVMCDLEQPALYQAVTAFAERLRTMRIHLVQEEDCRDLHQKQAEFLCATETYCEAVRTLRQDLQGLTLVSRGFLALQEHMERYIASEPFQTLVAEMKAIRSGLLAIRYCVHIRGDTCTVFRYQGEDDYSATVTATFKKFRQGAVKDYRTQFHASPDINHVEAQVLEFVARLFPECFQRLDRFCQRHHDYLDQTLTVFDREVQFYIAYLNHMNTLRCQGLKFCYPRVVCTHKTIFVRNGYDLALADKLLKEGGTVVCNDFRLEGQERIFIVSGPNQGGKTTFARMFGQLHYLASLGLPVPGDEACLFLHDRLFTHFEREESIRNLHGKLEDDLLRIHSILQAATPDSLIIMNEIFASTTLQDAVFLSTRILNSIVRLGSLCVCVTFIDELVQLSDTMVSMVSTITPGAPLQRTYKVVRRPADGNAHALSIVRKYRLGAQELEERLPS